MSDRPFGIAISFHVQGIKCDTCDYAEDGAKLDDYKEYLNKPCPWCGDPLLTEADHLLTIRIKKFIKMMNVLLFPLVVVHDAIRLIFKHPRMQTKMVELQMDGTGTARLKPERK